MSAPSETRGREFVRDLAPWLLLIVLLLLPVGFVRGFLSFALPIWWEMAPADAVARVVIALVVAIYVVMGVLWLLLRYMNLEGMLRRALVAPQRTARLGALSGALGLLIGLLVGAGWTSSRSGMTYEQCVLRHVKPGLAGSAIAVVTAACQREAVRTATRAGLR